MTGADDCIHHRMHCHMQNQEPTVLRPILVDIVGATIAGIAMLWQILTIFMGQKFSHVRLNYNPQGIYAGPYMVMSVVGYMMKDRIKEWGKRCAPAWAWSEANRFLPHRIDLSCEGHASVSLSQQPIYRACWHPKLLDELCLAA